VIFDLAAMMAGGAAAGIYTTCSAEEVQYIVDHSEAHAVLIEDRGQWDKLVAQRGPPAPAALGGRHARLPADR
jgi:long-chain acyl-CoA synthetase